MKEKKRELSLEEYKSLGKALVEMRGYLFNALFIVHKKTTRMNKFLTKGKKGLGDAINGIDKARDQLEESMFLNYPDRADIHTFYPDLEDKYIENGKDFLLRGRSREE